MFWTVVNVKQVYPTNISRDGFMSKPNQNQGLAKAIFLANQIWFQQSFGESKPIREKINVKGTQNPSKTQKLTQPILKKHQFSSDDTSFYNIFYLQ